MVSYSHDVLERREPVEELLAHLGVSLGDSWILYPVCIHMQLAPFVFVIFHSTTLTPQRHCQESLGIENEPKMEE